MTLGSDTGRAIGGLLLAALLTAACGPGGDETPPGDGATAAEPAKLETGLLVALAVLDRDAEGRPLPLPARLGSLTRGGGEWTYRTLEDPESNVFHKAMALTGGPAGSGVLTLGGTGAAVKLWTPDGATETLWQADFGGRFSRMRDAEIADLYGDGRPAIAVATHDQGVVAVLRPGEAAWSVDELDRQPDTFVHEIEIGDLDGDGVGEVYATPSAPNRVDGTAQPGAVVRYVPAAGSGRVVVADLGDRHAKEILVEDVDGDGVDELYVAVEAVSGGRVEIRRYDAGTDPAAGRLVAEIDDTLCRFLTAGDLDGDGDQELVAAAFRSGLWLLTPAASGPWAVTSIDRDSSGFEHAAVAADLDADGVDELYVASDRDGEIRRYRWQGGAEPERRVLHRYDDGLSRFTWNLMPVPVDLLPPPLAP